MAELLYGQRAAADYAHVSRTLDRSVLQPLELKDVQIHYVLFEVPMAVALECIPAGLHPSVPAHVGFTFWRCEESPFGPFECAWVGLACRTGIKPRHLVHGAFASNAAIAGELGRRYGFDCAVGEVHYREQYDRLHARIALGGRTVLELATTRMQPVVGAGAAVKYSPVLNPVRVGDGVTLVQMEAAYAFKRVLRGVPQVLACDAAGLGDARISPVYPMSGTHALADVTLMPPRFQADLTVPAEAGGARKLG